MQKKFFVTVLLICFSNLWLWAQPAAYYQSALGKNGAQLKTALHNIIDNHNSLSFPLWSSFGSTDNKGNNILWDIYSDVPGGTPAYVYTIGVNQCGQYNQEGDCYNHEHLWPKTYFNDAAPMDADLHHVYPVDGWVNNRRGSLPFGIVTNGGSYTSSNGSKVGSSNTYLNYTGAVFQPITEYRGDIARTFFYMSTRYEGEDANWSNWPMANKAELTASAVSLLLQWHQADPVSQKERDRNDAVFALQGNRNPFVDFPIFADCIWGTADCKPLSMPMQLKDVLQIYPNPTSDFLHIKLPAEVSSHAIRFTIYSIHGESLYDGQEQIIDVQKLPAGIYALQMSSADISEIIPFVKK